MKIQTLILSDPEFQGCSPDVCLKLLKRHRFEMSSAKEDIKVHMLMEMGIEHIETEDCRRALSLTASRKWTEQQNGYWNRVLTLREGDSDIIVQLINLMIGAV